jgi:two-component system cell cycle sensor histidine kinase/response regulator CckA
MEEKEKPPEIFMGEGTVLVVDDDDMVRDVGEQMLKAFGYGVLVARNGKEAIRLCKASKERIDMIILDMIMPEMGGGEAFDGIKEINPKAKVLLWSGYSPNGQISEILERGCDGFIQKPFSAKELSQKIRQILDRKQS